VLRLVTRLKKSFKKAWIEKEKDFIFALPNREEDWGF
jgi:hypothetical protein